MKAGYLYVLVHPSNPDLFKIGQTTRDPEVRLAEHNDQVRRLAGKFVKETGIKWQLKTFIEVPDPYWAEAIFWRSTPYSDMPYRNGIEVQSMSWECVLKGLEAAKKAGVRPPLGPLPDYVYAYRAWINKRLIGRGIILEGDIKSKTGKANFRCAYGHNWRTVPMLVAEGEGCPQCSIGERSTDDILKAINVGEIYLMISPNLPGFIKIGLKTNYSEFSLSDDFGSWQIHRYRKVEEPELAVSLIMNLLEKPMASLHEIIEVDLKIAEQAFRELHYLLDEEIAICERAKEYLKVK